MHEVQIGTKFPSTLIPTRGLLRQGVTIFISLFIRATYYPGLNMLNCHMKNWKLKILVGTCGLFVQDFCY